MVDSDDPVLWYALNRLMTNYWADVDHNGGSQAHEFYLPEALYAVGHNRFEGVKKIRAFYASRQQRGNTTTRHLVGNLQVFREGARRASTIGVMSLYRADGRPQFSGERTGGRAALRLLLSPFRFSRPTYRWRMPALPQLR
jgi:hypothetical protein